MYLKQYNLTNKNEVATDEHNEAGENCVRYVWGII
jgi:hypothetical protein